MYAILVFRLILRLISPVNKLRLTCEREKEDSVGTLKEAVVVVTGASRGLGKAIAEELAEGGGQSRCQLLQEQRACRGVGEPDL